MNNKEQLMKKSNLAIHYLTLFLQRTGGYQYSTPTKSLDVNGELRIRTLPAGAAADDILSTDANGNVRKFPEVILIADHHQDLIIRYWAMIPNR
jgi:hypothetical protein